MADHPIFAHQLVAARRAKERAELEMTGGHIIRAGYRRRPLPDEQIKPQAVGRSTGLDLWAPSPLIGFERNPTNFRIPAFLITPVAKTAIPRGSNGETLSDYPDPEASVVGHFGYIERQERAARTPNDYDYVERPEARDVSELGDVSYVCTNIDANPEVRKQFARAVYRHERLGKTKHKLLAGVDELDWWTALAAQPESDAWVREAARRLKTFELQSRAKADPDREKKVVIAEVTEQQAYDRIVWCQAQPGWDSKRQQVTFKPNIGGRVQYRFVFQLPYWISARERLEIVHKMARMMGKMGFMYVAAIHRPDPHNDSRNYHVHIDAYDRPCKYNKRLKKWDIEIFEKKRNGSLKPSRQGKISGFSRPTDQRVKHWDHWAGVIRNFREQFCAFTNEVLEQSPTLSPVRYHPGPFNDIGLNLRATRKLGGAQMAKEANGVRTPVGDINALKIWSDVFDAIYCKRKEAIGVLRARSRRTMALIAKVADPVTKHELGHDWLKLRQEEFDLIERCFRFELAQAEIAMMKSRAETIIREAGRRGVGRDEGKAYRKSLLAPLRDVALREAEAHIALVETFAPTNHAIAAELAAQRDEKARLKNCAQSIGAAILQSHQGTARADGIERLSPVSVSIPLALSGGRPTRAGPYDKLEIERLMAWFTKHGSSPEHFKVSDGNIIITARQAVCTRLVKHGSNPEVFNRVLSIARQLEAQTYDWGSEVSELVSPNASDGQITTPRLSEKGQSPPAIPAATAPRQVPAIQTAEQTSGKDVLNDGQVGLPTEADIREVAISARSSSGELPARGDTMQAPSAMENVGVEPAYVREDREFVEEELRAKCNVDSDLMSFFRGCMTLDQPAFYLDEKWQDGPPALLSFKEPEAVEILEKRLRQAANDDQVLRYIYRMMPTCPVASLADDDLRTFPVAELKGTAAHHAYPRAAAAAGPAEIDPATLAAYASGFGPSR